ncbi:nucleolar protein 12 [Galendromus occidentalis]|uniref:Nucleolar protein 12 n=1 Tax=Galendromus occidentalis TaxID=34638 RepID=A0AAJ6QXX7_9ACAR|nr:nucleolar protein 12 [Galendromus occidentalis]
MGKSKQQRKKQKKVILVFDENERKEFLSGFSKRKKERQRKAKVKVLTKLEGQKKKLLEEKRHIMADIVREGGIKLQDPQDLETVAGQTSTVDCGGHIVTITEFDDAYGAVKEPENEFEIADDGIIDESDLMAGGSSGDKQKIRLKQITQELKDFGVQIQPIKAALNEKAKKLKKRRQKLEEKREQESIRNKKNKFGQKAVKGFKRKKVNKHLIKD